MALKMAKMIAATMAKPNPSMLNEFPIKACVSINVIALITNKNNPSDRIVIGSVNTTRIGFTTKLTIAKIKLARSAAVKPSTSNPEKKPEMIRSTAALTRICSSHPINGSLPFHSESQILR